MQRISENFGSNTTTYHSCAIYSKKEKHSHLQLQHTRNNNNVNQQNEIVFIVNGIISLSNNCRNINIMWVRSRTPLQLLNWWWIRLFRWKLFSVFGIRSSWDFVPHIQDSELLHWYFHSIKDISVSVGRFENSEFCLREEGDLELYFQWIEIRAWRELLWHWTVVVAYLSPVFVMVTWYILSNGVPWSLSL